jgi:hypothetical protein
MIFLFSSRAACACLLGGVIVFQLPLAQSQSTLNASPSSRGINANSNHGANQESVADHHQGDVWFEHGRVIPGKSAADLRHRAYKAKIKMRALAAPLAEATRSAAPANFDPPTSPGGWIPLGPVPLASDATGDGFQNYNQVSGRATAVAIDPADGSGNTVYIGGAQGGVWKSANAAASVANNVAWSPLTDDQATLSIGAIAIQPGNTNPSQSVILAGTGEADSSADSYFGLGILVSTDGGTAWTLIPTANSGALSFAGLGATRIAFSTAAGQTNTVVAAMATSTEGVVSGAFTDNTYPGLYTSADAGETWTYDSILTGGASEATSATSVIYNAAAGLFFAALRYHGYYSSPDGLNWTLLPVQPGALSAASCPQDYSTACPIYRAELSVVPGRNEMYTWFISLDSNGNAADQGIWQSTNSGASWVQMNDSGILNCGDPAGCGVDQGSYNLALLALPNGSATDLYAGAINLYKCSITSVNPACANTAFLNLTHAYGCDPLAAPAHVHPAQHAMGFMLESSTDLMYFANDGGIYRALDGFTGLTSGSCSGTNLFDDLNQNLGSMTQFVSFSEHPTNENMLLGGTQGNGSPATTAATTSSSWGNVLSGDGAFSAIDSITGNWFASNPDTGGGTLAIQECSDGTSCDDSLFSVVVGSGDLGGDDGAFNFPYILDPQSASSMLVGTCRVWSGPRSGGLYTDLSLNFDTLGLGTCAGSEVNVVRSIAAGGPFNADGSEVIYATTDGLGPNNLSSPIGGNVWVTTNAAAVSGVSSTFSNATLNGPGGNSINPNQFPISSAAIDTSDPTGNTAYVTVMGFTGGPGHVWQTTNAGASWTDFSGSGLSTIPDSPANAVVVDAVAGVVYAGTDVGVFQSLTSTAAWTEVGPTPNAAGGVTGFLPDVAVTALAIFNSGGQELLRASTYGRGIWQFNLLAKPDFQIAIANTPLTVFAGQNAVFDGTLTSVNGYDNSVGLSCIAGATSAPSSCIASPGSVTPTQAGAPFTVTAGTSSVSDYSFNIQGVGSDSNATTHLAPVVLQVVNWSITPASPNVVTEPVGAPSPPVSFTITAQGTFNENVTLSCSFTPRIPGAICVFTPGTTFNLISGSPVTATASVNAPIGTPAGPYSVTVTATSSPAIATLSTSFTVNVGANFAIALTDTTFPNIKAGSSGTTGAITISSQDQFSGSVNLSCITDLANTCSVIPALVSLASGGSATATLTINAGTLAAGSYQLMVQGTSGSLINSLAVPFIIEDYEVTGPSTLITVPGAQAVANLAFTSEDFYSGSVVVTCNAAALTGAQCILNPPSPITIGSGAQVPVTATVTVPVSASASTYNIQINTADSTGEPTHALTLPLTVQDFTFSSITPPSQSVGSGNAASYNIVVSPVGATFTSGVNLSCLVTAPSSTCNLSASIVTPGAGAAVKVTANTTPATPQGSYSVVITGTSGSLSHSVTIPLTVANTLALTITKPFPSPIDAGSQQVPATISLVPNYVGTVNATCVVPAQSGTQCTLTPASASNTFALNSAPITIGILINVLNNATPGTYNVDVGFRDAGASQTPSQSVTLPFTVAQDYDIANLSAASQTISAGQSITYNLSVAPVGASYSNPVALTCSIAPALTGSTCALSPTPVSLLSGATATVMTITTTAASSQLQSHGKKNGSWLYALWLGFPAILILSARASARVRRRDLLLTRLVLRLVLAAGILLSLLSCGSGSNGFGTTVTTTGTPVPYTITVIGTPASLNQPNGEEVTLIVQ